MFLYKQDNTRIFHSDTWHQSMDYNTWIDWLAGQFFGTKTSLFGMRVVKMGTL